MVIRRSIEHSFCLLTIIKVFDSHRIDLFGRLETQNPGVEVEFRFQCPAYRLRLAEPMLLALEGEVCVGQFLRIQNFNQCFGLRRWHHRIFQTLKEDHWSL